MTPSQPIKLSLLIVLIVLSLVFIVVLPCLHFFRNVPERRQAGELGQALQYGITLDATSTKTTLVLYSWKDVQGNKTAVVVEKASESMNLTVNELSDISTFVNKLKTTLQEWSSIGVIEPEAHKSSQILVHLGATDGMRLIDASKLNEIRGQLKQLFETLNWLKVGNVDMLSGEKEALYSWMTANYLLGNVSSPSNRSITSTVGILKMDDASALVAFATNFTSMREEEVTNLIGNEKAELFGTNYDVYAHSNICFGPDAARRRYYLAAIIEQNSKATASEHIAVIEDPCTHSGQPNTRIAKMQFQDVCTNNYKKGFFLEREHYVFTAKPDIKRCQALTKKLVDATDVNEHFADHQKNISFTTIPEPPPSDMQFYALATYYATISQLRNNETIRFQDENELETAIAEYCGRPWDGLLDDYCFKMNYIFMNLKHVYNFSGGQFGNIEFRESLNGIELSWTLGYMLQAFRRTTEFSFR